MNCESPRAYFGLIVLAFVQFFSGYCCAVTPESPEVRKLIEDGKKFLEANNDHRLGGKCLVALAFLKDGASLTHPRIVEALEACQTPGAAKIETEDANYSLGLAIIFLAELDGKKHRSLIGSFAAELQHRQKSHGGWGYENMRTGDTSQTQYAALCSWELLQIGMPPSVSAIEACANWLIKTQDPSGTWGYQGKIREGEERVKQSKTSISMLAAGMGSTLIYGNILGILTTETEDSENPEGKQNLPSALKRADTDNQVRTLSGNGVDPKEMRQAISLGNKWWNENFDVGAIRARSHYAPYLLYSIERYKSFEELVSGIANEEPEWYQIGYEYLKGSQQSSGGWSSSSGKPCATAFSVLFLLRSTQKSIKASLGQGTLIGGRGLSADLSRMTLRGGRLVTEHKPTEVDNFLKLLDGQNSEDLDSLLNDPAALQVTNVGPEEIRRLQQVVKSGGPEARVLSVRALSRMRDLDLVPTLLYAMTDPDTRVVREARDGLRYVSRRLDGFGLKDNFNDSERYNALDRWKSWYRKLRPDAIILP